jgi:hypothetical protein
MTKIRVDFRNFENAPKNDWEAMKEKNALNERKEIQYKVNYIVQHKELQYYQPVPTRHMYLVRDLYMAFLGRRK